MTQEDLIEKPAHLPDSVLWTFKSAQEAGAPAGLSTTNAYRPTFTKALRDSKGNKLDSSLVKLIRRTARHLSEHILARHPIEQVAVDIKHIREYYRTKCPQLWYGSIVLLEQRHKEVGLCSAHWKADHLLGQSILALRQARKKQANGEIVSDPDSSDERPTTDGMSNLSSKVKRPGDLSPSKPGPSKRSRIGKQGMGELVNG